jgi:hypothetical protein
MITKEDIEFVQDLIKKVEDQEILTDQNCAHIVLCLQNWLDLKLRLAGQWDIVKEMEDKNVRHRI